MFQMFQRGRQQLISLMHLNFDPFNGKRRSEVIKREKRVGWRRVEENKGIL